MTIRHQRTWHHAGLLALTLSLAACGGGSSDSDASSGGAGGANLVGLWQADANALLAANTANVGTPGVDCSGLMQLRFEAGDSFNVGGEVVCTSGAMSGNGTLVTTGNYRTSGDQLTLSNATTSGGITLGGSTLPISFVGNGSATYRISGNTLTLTFSGGSAGTITQQWTRG